MPARAARSTLAAVTAVLALFLLLLLMVVRVPADAAGNGNGAKADAAADNGKSGEEHGKSADSNGKAADKAAADSAQPTAASTNSPQPLSNADQNPGGANNGGDCGAYCSTRDGSPSGNGNGGGVAKGKPCAGCVGKADNKNPPGQAPDGSDHNNGYECDGNNGIAKTNPAHIGCKTQSPSPTPTGCVPSEANDNCGTPSPGCTPSVENDNCGTPSPGCTPSVENDNCGTPSVSPSSATQSPTITPSVKGVKIVKPPVVQPGRLPRTGTAVPIGLLLVLGFGTIALGVGVTVATPSHRH